MDVVSRSAKGSQCKQQLQGHQNAIDVIAKRLWPYRSLWENGWLSHSFWGTLSLFCTSWPYNFLKRIIICWLMCYDYPNHWLTTCKSLANEQAVSDLNPPLLITSDILKWDGWCHGSDVHLLCCLCSIHIIKVRWGDTQKAVLEKIIAPCGIHWLCRQCLRCLRWLSRVSTVGNGRPWSSGSQSLPPPRGHQMWEPSPGDHKAGPLMCWYRRGKTLSCQTPGWVWRIEGQIRWVTTASCNAVPIIHFLKLTWIRLFPQSATMIFPLASTATPVGALNWPFPSPCEPNLNKNSPSALYTCQVRLSTKENGWTMLTSKEKCQSHPHSMRSTAVCDIWLSLPAFSCSVETDWFYNRSKCMVENNGGEQVCSLYPNAKHYFKIKKPAK